MTPQQQLFHILHANWRVLQLLTVHFRVAPLVAPKLIVELASSSYRRFSAEASRSSVATSSCTTSNTSIGSAAVVLTEQQR